MAHYNVPPFTSLSDLKLLEAVKMVRNGETPSNRLYLTKALRVNKMSEIQLLACVCRGKYGLLSLLTIKPEIVAHYISKEGCLKMARYFAKLYKEDEDVHSTLFSGAVENNKMFLAYILIDENEKAIPCYLQATVFLRNVELFSYITRKYQEADTLPAIYMAMKCNNTFFLPHLRLGQLSDIHLVHLLKYEMECGTTGVIKEIKKERLLEVIFSAVMSNSVAVVKYLLKHERSKTLETLNFSISQGKRGITREILSDDSLDVTDLLRCAIIVDDYSSIAEILKMHESPTLWLRLIRLACKNDELEIIKFCELNCGRLDYRSLLCVSVVDDSISLVKYLCEYKKARNVDEALTNLLNITRSKEDLLKSRCIPFLLGRGVNRDTIYNCLVLRERLA